MSLENNLGLIITARNGNLPRVNYYLTQGANINWQDHGSGTALHAAARYNNLEIVKVLLERGIDINSTDKDGHTALDIAKEEGNKDVIDYLKDYPTLMGMRMLDEHKELGNINFDTLDDLREYSQHPKGGKRRRKTVNKRRKTVNKRRKTVNKRRKYK